jgi:hypothetical protein
LARHPDRTIAIGKQADAPDREAFLLEPLFQSLRDGAFAAHGAVDVADFKRESNELVPIDSGNHIVVLNKCSRPAEMARRGDATKA